MAGKLLLFDFLCANEHLQEVLVQSEVHTRTCPACGGESIRLIPTPRIDPRLGVDPAFGTMSDKWARKHQQARRLDETREREHGPDREGADGSDRGR